MMNKTSIDESQNLNLEDGSDRQTKKESDRVHVSTCLQRDSETREYTKADNGLSHNLALPLLAPHHARLLAPSGAAAFIDDDSASGRAGASGAGLSACESVTVLFCGRPLACATMSCHCA